MVPAKTLRHEMEAARAARDQEEHERLRQELFRWVAIEEARMFAAADAMDAEEPGEGNAPEQDSFTPGRAPPPVFAIESLLEDADPTTRLMWELRVRKFTAFPVDEFRAIVEAVQPKWRELYPDAPDGCHRCTFASIMYITLVMARMNQTAEAFSNIHDFPKSNVQRAFEKGVRALSQTASEDFHQRVSNLGTDDGLPTAGFHNGFENATGMVDGSHIWIRAPRGGDRGAQGFDNAKQYWRGKAPTGYAVTFSIVANAEGRVLFCTRVYPGSMHDMRVLRESGLADEFAIRLGGRITHRVIGGDLAYKSADKVSAGGLTGFITPYKKPAGGSLTEEQRAFNRAFSSQRIIVENVFGRLKQKFGMIGQKCRVNVKLMDDIVMAAVWLTDYDISMRPLRPKAFDPTSDDGEM